MELDALFEAAIEGVKTRDITDAAKVAWIDVFLLAQLRARLGTKPPLHVLLAAKSFTKEKT